MNRLDRRTVFSILIGLFAVVILVSIWGWTSRDRDPERIGILYAKKDLPAWIPISDTAVAEKEIPYRAYKRGSYYTSKTQLVGRRPVVNIEPGQILRPEMFQARNSDISTLLPAGTVAYSLSLTGRNLRIPQSVSVGDRVDMLAEIRSKIVSDVFLLTVAENLLVVNIERGTSKDSNSSIERVARKDSFLNNMTARRKSPNPLVPQAIVLALTREQVQDIELAESAGADFTLLLRANSEEGALSQNQSRTLTDFLRSKGVDLAAAQQAKEDSISQPTVRIVRGVQPEDVPIQNERSR